jgi:thiamine kinase-like enzyme
MALKWLKSTIRSDIKFPKIVLWERKEKMLVMSRYCYGGTTLESRLKKWQPNLFIAQRISAFLAHCHSAFTPDEPFRDNNEQDQENWSSVLQQHLSSINLIQFNGDLEKHLGQLQAVSAISTSKQFAHLDFQPKNILIKNNEIAVVDFEMSSTFGDPAYDLGILLGHYLFHGVNAQHESTAWQIFETIIHHYASSRKIAADSGILNRARAFAGSTILSLLTKNSMRVTQSNQLERIAKNLLASLSL